MAFKEKETVLMKKWIQRGLILAVFIIPLIFSRQTTDIYGLIKIVVVELLTSTLLILWLVRLLWEEPRSHIYRSPLNLPVLSLLAVSCLSLIKAVNIHIGLNSLYLLASFIILFFLIINNIEKITEVEQIMVAAIVAGVLSCGYSIFQNKGINLGVSRFSYGSTFGNPIFFAQYLVTVIPLSIAMCFRQGSRSWIPKVFFGTAAVLMLLFLLLTRSLAAYLGLIAAILVMSISFGMQYKNWVKLKRILIWAVTACIILVIIVFSFSSEIRRDFSSRQLHGLMRIYVWQSTLKMVGDYPIMGVGVGNFRIVYPLYRSAQEKTITWKGVTYFRTHNDFLQIWAEQGTLGLICFLWIIYVLLRLAGQLLKKEGSQEKILTAGLLASIVAILVVAFFNPAFEIASTGMCLWVLAGLIAVLARLKAYPTS